MPLITDENKADIIVEFDVHNTVYRAAEAPGPTKSFKNQHGWPTGYLFVSLGKVFAALKHYGINQNLNTCLVLSAQENSDFRRDMYPNYKSGRVKKTYSPLEITNAYGRLEERSPDPVEDFMELALCLPCINLKMRGKLKETDDALASFTHQTKKTNKKAIFYIVSNDRDLWNLQGKRVVCTSKPKEEFTLEHLKRDYQITKPKLLPLAKALFGDSSDKIKKAVAGVTEENIPSGFLDLVLPQKGEGLAEAFERTLRKHKSLVTGTSLEKCLGKTAEIESVMNIIRLRKNLQLDLVKTKPDLKKMQMLLKWYELKSQLQPSEVMISHYRP